MKLIGGVVILIVFTACNPIPDRDPGLVGLWQFPDRGVWIRIDEDGTAFQCRVAMNEEIIQSHGRFTSASKIRWETNWDTDSVALVDDTLQLDGKFGAFTFVRAAMPMADACRASETR